MNSRAQIYQQQLLDAGIRHAMWETWWRGLTSVERQTWLDKHRLIRDEIRAKAYSTEVLEQRAEQWLRLTWGCIRLVNK